MKVWYYLAAMLILSGMILPASSQEQVALTVYVHEGDLDGALLTGVKISGQDASGNEFVQTTDTSGAAVVQGERGTWQFAFQKEGYDTLYLTYNATQTEETAAFLTEETAAFLTEVAAANLEENDATDLVTLTINVHEGDLNGDTLSAVQIKGQDGNGNEFVQTTDSSGVAVVQGVPGTWQFAFQKEGYEILFLTYNATQTEETAAYLEKSA
ncbi:MAG: hypothetical protein PHW87_06520 [Methanothrix sp.]|nr:hypothetical protein [Methanothrix sp.]